MNILFWNTYRLGAGSDAVKKSTIETVVRRLRSDYCVQQVVCCEITSDFDFCHSFSSTRSIDIPVDKQAFRHVQRRTARAAQLGYAAFSTEGHARSWCSMDIDNHAIGSYGATFGHAPAFAGGGIFTNHSRRLVGKVDSRFPIPIYVYHANASDKSEDLVPWVLNDLVENSPGGFILTGDFNCEPWNLTDIPAGVHWGTGGPTHNAFHGLYSTYDYAFFYHCQGEVMAFDYRAQYGIDYVSDHLPILIRVNSGG